MSHHVAYVLVPNAEVKTSLEARQKVMDELSNDTTFVGEGGRFGTHVCDWFQIGGGWSGDLNPKQLRQAFHHQVDQLNVNHGLEEYRTVHSYNSEQLDAIWRKLGGKFSSPLTRQHNIGELGEEDDARLLDQELAEELNVYLRGGDIYHNNEEYHITRQEWLTPVVISLDNEALYKLTDFNNLVGKYWVVVIDYHT